jgi:hypothetical protein
VPKPTFEYAEANEWSMEPKVSCSLAKLPLQTLPYDLPLLEMRAERLAKASAPKPKPKTKPKPFEERLEQARRSLSRSVSPEPVPCSTALACPEWSLEDDLAAEEDL